MSTTVGHTALPWIRDRFSGINCDVRAANGRKVALCWGLSTSNSASYRAECDANAAYIVQSANAYPVLVEALEKIAERDSDGFESLTPQAMAHIARAALSTAGRQV